MKNVNFFLVQLRSHSFVCPRDFEFSGLKTKKFATNFVSEKHHLVSRRLVIVVHVQIKLQCNRIENRNKGGLAWSESLTDHPNVE
jgi:hypothetical protein